MCGCALCTFEWVEWLWFAVVDADVVNLVTDGEDGRVVGCDAGVECEVDEQIEGAVERVDTRTAAFAVDGLRKGNLVEEFVVQIEADELVVPVHAPDMEARRPCGVVGGEMVERPVGVVPAGVFFGFSRPAGVGKDSGSAVQLVVFQHVYLAVSGPRKRTAEQPDSRPGAGADRDTGTYLHATIEKTVVSPGDNRTAGVLHALAAQAPVAALGVVVGAGKIGGSGLDDKHAVPFDHIKRRIVLRFIVAHKALLVTPLVGVRPAETIELVLPGEGVAI